MQDLRSEIRAAFEKEQSAFPPAGDLRPRLVRHAATEPRARLNLQWLAIAAAFMIAALVVVGLMSARLTNRGTVSPPKANPSPIGDYGPPPAGVPLFFVGAPNHPGWYTGIDWAGQPQGTIKLAQPPGEFQSLNQAPNGSGFVVNTFKGEAGAYLDRLGQPLPDGAPGMHFQDLMWADDSSRLCTLDGSLGKWRMGLMTPGSAPTSVNAVALDSFVSQSGVIAVHFAACSPRNDRAVLVYSLDGYPTFVWVVRISDGKILYREAHDRNQLAGVVASPDGSLIAESSNKSTGYIAGPTAPHTSILRAVDHSVVATLDPADQVLAISSDNRLALMATSPYASGLATHLELIQIANGAILWRYDGPLQLSGFIVQPTVPGFAVMLQSPIDTSMHPEVIVVIACDLGHNVAVKGSFTRP